MEIGIFCVRVTYSQGKSSKHGKIYTIFFMIHKTKYNLKKELTAPTDYFELLLLLIMFIVQLVLLYRFSLFGVSFCETSFIKADFANVFIFSNE